MPNNAIAPSTKSLADYVVLRRRVREAIAAGKERALEAVEREGVRTKWEVGKLIQEHILLNKDRADYGVKVIRRLSGDLQINNTDLKYMREFARTYPIGPPVGQFSWGKIRILLSVNEEDQRKRVAERASKEDWSRGALQHEIKKLKAAKGVTVSEAPAEEPLVPRKGTLDTYRIITAKAGPWTGKQAIDLGFANYLSLDSGQAKKFKDRDVVELVGAGLKPVPTWKIQKSKRTEGDLFTYRAYLLQVTDADTLWCLIDLGFGFVTQQHLRLRGIDAPEITTREGQRAKRFVERELGVTASERISKSSRAVIGAPAPIIITTTKSDKYDPACRLPAVGRAGRRYLADIFYTRRGGERFLNNRLLEAGLARRV